MTYWPGRASAFRQAEDERDFGDIDRLRDEHDAALDQPGKIA